MSTTENMQRYKRLRYPDDAANNNAINNNNNKNNKIRAYRLNLERPFNILNEQSPLEYGDYMKIWNEKDYPPTMGPVEYMPPRHLGGNAQVWTTLMQFSRIPQNTKTKDVDNNDAVVTDSLQRLNLQEQEVVIDDADADHYFTNNNNNDDTTNTSLPLPLSYSNWRILTPDEITYHRNLGEIDPRTGEYTFRTYDLHHVVEKRRYKNNLDVSTAAEESDAVFDADADGDSPTSTAMELITVLSTETDGSEYDRTNTSTPQDMENMTARLFRRSELSLREKEIKIKKLQEEEERLKQENERRREMEERARCIAEGKKYKRSTSTASSGGKRGLKSSSKKLIKSLSSLSSKLNNPGMGGGEYSRSGSGISVCQNPKLMKKSSAQASAIEKARDLIDEDDGKEEGDDVDNLDKKKPLNLYIYGEYDVLNDLVNDGAKRLSKSKHLSDIDLLLQNDPCPPPDRWVRPTGWSLCNPSSCYAANPPEGYDLNSYNTNLVKLPKEQETAAAKNNNNAVNTASIKYSTISEGAKMSPKDSDGTQTTAADISGSTSEDLFDNRSSSSKVQVSVKTLSNTELNSRSSLKQSGTSAASSVKSNAASRTKAAAASSSSGSINNNNNGIKKKKKSVGKRLSGMFK